MNGLAKWWFQQINTYSKTKLQQEIKKGGILRNIQTYKQTDYLMVLGLLACVLDLVRWTVFGASVVNA